MLEGNLLAGNALFARANARGLDLAVYQSDYVRFNLPDTGIATCESTISTTSQPCWPRRLRGASGRVTFLSGISCSTGR